MTTIGISSASSFAPDSSKAKSAAASIFGIIDRKSKIDSRDESGTVLENVKGDIELCHLSFAYQTRPDIQIFRDLCLSIRAGKVTHLVLFQQNWSDYKQILLLSPLFFILVLISDCCFGWRKWIG